MTEEEYSRYKVYPRAVLQQYFVSNMGEQQTHVHEFQGSTRLSGPTTHNHRIAGVSSQKFGQGDSHYHAILTNTDYDLGHLHEIGFLTGPAIQVGADRHVHFAYGVTTFNADHDHAFIFATLIEDPLGPVT